MQCLSGSWTAISVITSTTDVNYVGISVRIRSGVRHTQCEELIKISRLEDLDVLAVAHNPIGQHLLEDLNATIAERVDGSVDLVELFEYTCLW